MEAKDYWNIFLETGAPEAYLMYARALKSEVSHVSDNKSLGAADHGLQ